MLKLLVFNVLVSFLCAGAWNYLENGTIGLDWSFLNKETSLIKNIVAD